MTNRTPDLFEKYRRFLPIAQSFAAMSKYSGTKVGCVILGLSTFEVRSSGWNGAPRGSSADTDGRLATRESRLRWASHAESNAIANAARMGVSLIGTAMVVTHTPCLSCAKLIVQSGISFVISPLPSEEFAAKWGDEFDHTRHLFKECGIGFHEFDTTER